MGQIEDTVAKMRSDFVESVMLIVNKLIAPLEQNIKEVDEDQQIIRNEMQPLKRQIKEQGERIVGLAIDVQRSLERDSETRSDVIGQAHRLKELERKHDNHSHDESGRPIDTPEYDPRLQPGYADRPDPPPERECICGEDYVRYTSEDKILCANCHGVVKPELRVLEPEDRPEPRVKVVDWEKQIKTLQTDNAALREEVEDNRKETTDWHDYLTALQIKGILPDGADLEGVEMRTIPQRLEILERKHIHIQDVYRGHTGKNMTCSEPDPPPERPECNTDMCSNCPEYSDPPPEPDRPEPRLKELERKFKDQVEYQGELIGDYADAHGELRMAGLSPEWVRGVRRQFAELNRRIDAHLSCPTGHADPIEPDPPPERPYTAVTCTKCKATRWINTGNDVHKCPRCGGMMIEEQEQDRPEPGEPCAKHGVFGCVMCNTGDPPPEAARPEPRTMKRSTPCPYCGESQTWRHIRRKSDGEPQWICKLCGEVWKEPADPPECLCRERRIAEELGIILFKDEEDGVTTHRLYRVEDAWEEDYFRSCPWCKGEIRKSLIGGE